MLRVLGPNERNPRPGAEPGPSARKPAVTGRKWHSQHKGHDRLATTVVYTHCTPEDLADAMDELSDVDYLD